LYQPDATKRDWVSDEKVICRKDGDTLLKNQYDPCPAGWRIVDMESVSTGIILGILSQKVIHHGSTIQVHQLLWN
jgi:hypothetical protein